VPTNSRFFAVGIPRLHRNLPNRLAAFGDQLEVRRGCRSGRDINLKSRGPPGHRLSLYPEEPFVTGTAGRLALQIRLERNRYHSGPCPEFSSLDDPSFKMGIGIHGMRERVRLLNGTFELRSGNTGTTIIVVLPAQNISKRTIES
jgi:hypothetical protein